MNLTIGKKVHHPPLNSRDVFLCGDYRGYTPHDGFRKPWPVEREVDCLECLYALKRLNIQQMADSGITFRIIARMYVGESLVMDYPSFYLSSLTTPEVKTSEDAVKTARVILNVPKTPIPTVSYDIRAVKVKN